MSNKKYKSHQEELQERRKAASKLVNGKKPLDAAMEAILERDKKTGEMKPHLDRQLKIIEKLDNKIEWFNGKIKEIEQEKQKEIQIMADLLDSALTQKHELNNGYYIRPDDRRKVEVEDTAAFLKWLKANKPPEEVFKFFIGALKITHLKSFCEKEAIDQRLAGKIIPEIDGVRFGEVTFTRYTTGRKEKKK